MYDIIIIGAGVGGLTSAIYAKEANKSVLILEKVGAGGQLNNINKITNYPGFSQISGYELTENIKNQALNLGVELKREEVISVKLNEKIKKITTHKNIYEAKAVIIATGAYAKQLELNGEKQFLGRGLSYCATCDGNFFKEKTVAVIGGGNTSMDDCIYLNGIAKKIYLIHRREEFTATDKLLNQVKHLIGEENSKIEVLTNSVVVELKGEEKLEQIKVLNKKENTEKMLQVEGLFVAIGRKPDTEFLNGQVMLDESGFILTDENMATNIKGVFAVGDVRKTPLRQVVTACSDGAIATNSIIKGINT